MKDNQTETPRNAPRSSPRVPAIAIALAALVAPAASAQSLLTAGDVDDNLNWSFFLKYTERLGGQNSSRGLPFLDLVDRVTLNIVGDDQRPLPFAQLDITPSGAASPSVRLFAGADGVLRFFPSHDGLGAARQFDVRVTAPGGSEPAGTHSLDLDALPANRTVEVSVPAHAGPPSSVDIMFVIDTTGSMGDELRYIALELEAIVAKVVALHPGADVRLGLTLYRDEGDAYVVRSLGFTNDVQTMEGWLAAQESTGGGDYPEAMDQALASSVREQWRTGATARLLFLVADAPPHPEGYAPFLSAVKEARSQGIHVYPLAASGVAQEAEYLMRQAAALTQGRYMFLTDDSGIGNAHAEPAIACYVVTKLDALFVRIVDSELTGRRVEPEPGDVVRRVGTYEKGVCLADPQQQGQDPEPETLGEEGGAGPGATSAPPGTATTTAAVRGRVESDGFEGDGFADTYSFDLGTTGPSSEKTLRMVADEGGRADGPASSKTPAPTAPVLLVALVVLALAVSRMRHRRG